MRVLVAGSSGFLGQHLTEALRAAGHDVVRLVRRATTAVDESSWDPYAGRLDPEVVGSCDVVVNLAGAPTAGNPHSGTWARELRESRVTTTRVLAEAIAASSRKPAFLAGNGISYYGDHGTEVLTETSDSRGDALLTQVAREWQAATKAADEAGARVCVLRTAPVLDKGAPPLKQMALPFRLGLGARLGDGHQSFPSISLRDWVGAVVFLAGSDKAGAFNLCCPDTPTNAEFTDALAAAVGRKARLAVPAMVLRPAAGAMANELLGSINARPAALEAAGYDFHDRDIAAVLASGLR
ncbi:MAG: TIGR01777 family oxidoreductase [Nocardioides sp.]